MAFNVTGRWKIGQSNINGTGTLSLRQQGWKITGTADWSKQNHRNGTIVGAIVGTTVSFSIIYPGDLLVGHYAANLNPIRPKEMTQGVGLSSAGDSATWDAKKAT
jgi:hypothetical protein